MKPLKHAASLAALLLLAPLGGCNFLGTAFVFFRPSMSIDAQYAIPKERQVVVIVDDYLGVATSPALTAAIASAAGHHLAADGGLKVVDDAKVRDAIAKLGNRWTGKKGEKAVSAASLGAALHADTVVYANIQAAQIQLADNIYQPQVTLSVKAYETATGACVFPVSPDGDNIRQTGFVIQSEITARDLSASGRSANSEAETKLAAQAGLDLAQLFYNHRPQKKTDLTNN